MEDEGCRLRAKWMTASMADDWIDASLLSLKGKPETGMMSWGRR
jgi:hypothetical protein